MNLQIMAIAIYNAAGKRRQISFELGAVNIITGAPKTGKTALIDIVDYCLGRDEFKIPSGVIRDTVVWYAIHVQLPHSQAVIARPAPIGGRASTNEVYLEVGGLLELPEFGRLEATTTTDGLVSFLTEAVGIHANVHITPDGQTRPSLQATIKHAGFLLYQPQYRIADRNLMFFRQDEEFVPQAIRDTLPFFLGASGDKQFDQLHNLRRARRELKILQRRLADEEALKGKDNSRAKSLLAEAQNVGLLGTNIQINDAAEMVSALKTTLTWGPTNPEYPPKNTLAAFQEARERLLSEYRNTQHEIDAARGFAQTQDDFGTEAKIQQQRLTAIGLFANHASSEKCPLCDHELNNQSPRAEAIISHLDNLSKHLTTTTRQRPRLEAFIEERENHKGQLRLQLGENKSTIEALVAQDEVLQENRNRTMEQARVAGKISLFLDSVRVVEDEPALKIRIEELHVEISKLEDEVSEDLMEEHLNSILQIIGAQMSIWAKDLRLEHSESPIGFDLRNLTAVAYREMGPIKMSQMGSGENWMGYHLISHLALHKWFSENRRPVPGFLMLDQPTQVYYPPERDPALDRSLNDLKDDDREAVKRLFTLIFRITQSLAPNLQVIITDHADLNEKWFQASVRARWRNGERLVPTSWYQSK